MRKQLVTAATAAAVLALPATASAGAVAVPTVLGNGVTKIGTDFNIFGQDLFGTASGAAAFANPALSGENLSRAGAMTCLKIDGKRAIFAIQTGASRYASFIVQDIGTNPSNPKDRVRGGGFSNTAPTCATVPTVSSRFTIASGNIEVNPVPAPPV